MENTSIDPQEENQKPIDQETQFENGDVDPGFGFEDHDEALEGIEDERSDNIDVNTSIKELRADARDDFKSE